MRIKALKYDFTVCKLVDYSLVNMSAEYFFVEKTDEENSLVCLTEDVPSNTMAREDGWKGFRIEGVLDFSLIGILSMIADLLAKNHISIFAVSTYNTDYVFVKQESFSQALRILEDAGCEVEE